MHHYLFNGAAEADFSEEDLSDALDGKTFNEAVNGILNTVKLTGTQAAVPYVGQNLPMTGTCDLTAGITAGTTIGSDSAEIGLTRVAAKVTVENSAAGFTLARRRLQGRVSSVGSTRPRRS